MNMVKYVRDEAATLSSESFNMAALQLLQFYKLYPLFLCQEIPFVAGTVLMYKSTSIYAPLHLHTTIDDDHH